MSNEGYEYRGGPLTAERSRDEQGEQVEQPEETAHPAYGSETDDPQDTYSPETTETDGAAEAAADPAIESYLEQPPAVSDPYTTGHIPPVSEPSAPSPNAGRTAVPMTAMDHSARMQEIQVAFIDDPRQAALDADDLLAEVLQSFTAELARQRDALNSSSADGVPDTERMRLAVRRSRQLIDTLANLD